MIQQSDALFDQIIGYASSVWIDYFCSFRAYPSLLNAVPLLR